MAGWWGKSKRDQVAIERQQRNQAVQAIAEGRSGARDRFGKPVGPGSLVILLQPDAGTVWTVEDAKPMLDPRAPVGAIELTLTCRLQFRTVAGQGINSMAVVGQLEPVKPETAAPANSLTVRDVEADRGEVAPAKGLVTEH